MEGELVGEHFSWGMMPHVKMVGKLDRCCISYSGDFSFGSILVAWFLDRVPMFFPRLLLGMPSV
jgi:hypothetical protein